MQLMLATTGADDSAGGSKEVGSSVQEWMASGGRCSRQSRAGRKRRGEVDCFRAFFELMLLPSIFSATLPRDWLHPHFSPSYYQRTPQQAS
jgi:hypothetical protein